eukprot:gnl/TRDRNA2_/TRDRNA2_88053_c0_seq2.p1 gnl/TRDRNA2_/TRDRNA2_88053_c0~~gnl/TRDRNA2_/TRDRNA2_88053_c0_seq2.p1  ORF type:complete len:236 (-),score=29.14 gnl/TRDRNA2_/TRDRNA2_88053_c0_seq2:100-807(-)
MICHHLCAEAVFILCWTVVNPCLVRLVPFKLSIGFVLAMPPVTFRFWCRSDRMPLLPLQVAQVFSGTRSLNSLAQAVVGHTVGALAGVYLLQTVQSVGGMQDLVPNPKLGDGISPLLGMFVEAFLVAHVILMLSLVPNWLLSKGLPRICTIFTIMPAMMLCNRLTGPSVQPIITMSRHLLMEGQAAAVDALLPYLCGPLLGAAMVGLALRDRQLPYQDCKGLPARFVVFSAKKSE